MAADREADAYEYDVNVRSILNLIPGDGKSLLDVGTGGGDFIPKLEDRFENIEGSDVSPNMLEIARERFPNHLFYLWDLEEPFPENKKYDVIICKLVLMFVENLDNVANEFKTTLNPNGVAIISVVHPIYWYTNFLLNQHKIKFHPEFEVMDSGYYSTGRKIIETFDGNKDIQIGFIHRTISDYINPFSKVGLQVTEIDEPQITTTFVKSNPRFADRLHVPFRLNFRVNKL
jgi:predicted TPR repeat methyltransferase